MSGEGVGWGMGGGGELSRVRQVYRAAGVREGRLVLVAKENL